MIDVVIDELKKNNDLVANGYFAAREKLRRKRIRYGIDCRAPAPFLCIYIEDELFDIMYNDNIPDEIVRAIFLTMT